MVGGLSLRKNTQHGKSIDSKTIGAFKAHKVSPEILAVKSTLES